MTELSLVDRFGVLERALGLELVERSEEIRCALLALVAGKTLFLVGEPGIAKSMLARRIHAYIVGGEFFDLDLDKFTTAEDLFGPRDLGAMRAGRWERVVEGSILTAHWAMLDEFFEASSAVLKTLLRILNERTYRNGTDIVSSPLTTVICASNVVPAESRLMPLYDRLLIRRQLSRIRDHTEFGRMLGIEPVDHPQPVLRWAQVEEAQAAAGKLTVAEATIRAVVDIRRSLAEEHIVPSDRRFREAMRVVRAAAWLDGDDCARPEHLWCLRDICWHDPAQIPTVNRVIDEVLEPILTGMDRLMRDIRQIDDQIRPEADETKRKMLAVELHDKIMRADSELQALTAGPLSPLQEKKAEIARVLRQQVAARIVRELFEEPI
jgi:MoxR-like ATPase